MTSSKTSTPAAAAADDQIIVRTIEPDEVPAWGRAVSTGFLNVSTDEEIAIRSEGRDPKRSRAAFDGSRIVGTFASFPTDVTVPGGATLPATAITAVTTTATHRRRGILTRMMDAELSDAVAWGDALGILIAAEWPIYGRFGFGAASEWLTLTMDKATARLRDRPTGRVELATGEEVRAVVPGLHERTRLRHPGDIQRPERFWDFLAGIATWPNNPDPKPFHALARDDAGDVIGYARYGVQPNWVQAVPKGVVSVSELLAVDSATEALLWDYLLSLDLVATVVAEHRGPGDVLPWLLTDGRAVRASDASDGLWLRVLDPVRALTARRYLAPGRLVLEIVDRQDHAAGRFALDGGPDGATCELTTEAPELTLDVSVLGAAYLGGTSLALLHAAGLVDEHRAGAVSRADAMFRSEVAPWCSTGF